MSKRGENIYKRKDRRYEGRCVKGYCDDGKTNSAKSIRRQNKPSKNGQKPWLSKKTTPVLKYKV